MTDLDRLRDEREPDELDELASEFYERRAREREAFEAGLDAQASAGIPDPSARAGIVNTGAAHEYFEGDFSESEPQGRDNFAELMQPSNRDRSRVNREGKSIPAGGGGSGGAQNRKLSFKDASEPDNEGEDLAGLSQFRVPNLSERERAYYDSRGTEARAVLCQIVAGIGAGDFADLGSWRNVGSTTESAADLVLYVTPEMRTALRSKPGLARHALAEHAQANGCERVRAWSRKA